jgi:hypothetical protein
MFAFAVGQGERRKGACGKPWCGKYSGSLTKEHGRAIFEKHRVPSMFGDFKNLLYSSLQIVFLLLAGFVGVAAGEDDVKSLIRHMQRIYSAVDDYQTMTTVLIFRNDGPAEIQRFLYSFKKPDHVRMDFQTPHPGAVLFYPDDEGRVVVRLAGIAGILPLRLSLNNPRLVSFGQRIDQTDMGLLITNIFHSVTDEKKGPVSLTEDGDLVHMEVLAVDHFVKERITFYRFTIDRSLMLPVGVEESTPEGLLRRRVTFADLAINRGLSDRFMGGRSSRPP